MNRFSHVRQPTSDECSANARVVMEPKPQGDACHMSPLCAVGAPVKYTEDCWGCKYHCTTDAEYKVHILKAKSPAVDGEVVTFDESWVK